MPLPVLLLVLFGAMLHATWNAMVKAGKDRYLDTVVVLTGAALLTLIWLPFLPLPARACWPYLTASIIVHLLYFTLIALYTLIDGKGVRLSDHSFSYTSWGFLLDAILFTPIALLIRRDRAIPHLRKEWSRGLIGGGCSICAYGLALWAMTKAPIASVAALRETSIIFGIILAAITLKERVSRLRFAAVLLVLAGALLIKL